MENNKFTILVVDDNQENIKVIGSILRKNDFNVLAVTDGKKATEIVLIKKVDLILLDIQMPELDGFEVFNIINSNPLTKDIPIIFLTARKDEETILKVFEIGAADYVSKPFSQSEVMSRVKTQIELRKYKEKLNQTIDGLEEAKNIAESANRSKSDFLANMSHEIRTPLNSIIGFSEVLAEEEINDEKLDKLKIIVSSGKHLLNIINDLLDFSKIEEGKVEIIREPFSVRNMIENIKNMFEMAVKNKGLAFQIKIEESIPEYVLGDEYRVKEILINLISNSLKFTTEGEISINCSYNADNLSVAVYDTGIGIPVEKQARIFSAFDQGGDDVSRKFGGTGLGLSISKSLAKIMDGDISLESEVDKWTKFTVELSLPEAEGYKPTVQCDIDDVVDCWIKEDPEISDLVLKAVLKIPEMMKELEISIKSNDIESINLASHKLKGFFGNFNMNNLYDVVVDINEESQNLDYDMDKIEFLYSKLTGVVKKIPSHYLSKTESVNENIFKILVAEDVEDNRNLIEFMLKRLNVSIEFAENGVEALEKLEKDSFNLMLLDMQMPVMGGLETIQKLRTKSENNELYVIALTAQASLKDKDDMLNAGCNGFLTKPIDKNILRKEIQKRMNAGGYYDK